MSTKEEAKKDIRRKINDLSVQIETLKKKLGFYGHSPEAGVDKAKVWDSISELFEQVEHLQAQLESLQ